jgi:hypothetical protein
VQRDACGTGPLDPGLMQQDRRRPPVHWHAGLTVLFPQGDSDGPAKMAPISLVMMVPLVFKFQDKLSESRLSEAQYNTTQPTFSLAHLGHDVLSV